MIAVIALAACGRSVQRPPDGGTAAVTTVVDRPPDREAASVSDFVLIGTSGGLYWWDGGSRLMRLRSGGEVRKILLLPYGVLCSGSEGILFTSDLSNFEVRNSGLNMKVIKHVTNGAVFFTSEPQDVNDLERDPVNPDNLVACSRSGAFVSTNRGLNWEFIRTPSWSSGVKSVAIYNDGRLEVLLGHPFGGIYKLDYSKREKAWKKFSEGLFQYEDVYEEVSDIKAVSNAGGIALYAANNFSPHIQLYDTTAGKWVQVYRPKESFDLIESFSVGESSAHFVSLGGVREWDMHSPTNANVVPELTKFILKLRTLTGERVECMTFVSNGRPALELSGLWTLNPPEQNRYASVASGRRGLYLQAGYADNGTYMNRLFTLMSNTGLNMITIDMKDDSGNLRFKPESETLRSMGTSRYAVDIDNLVAQAKARGIYLVARIVLFKDKRMYDYDNGRYAVKDSVTGRPWRGRRVENGQTNDIPEYWVDPYAEEVWQYNVEISKELIRRGFNEIQFDYIRFPTDGINLWRANFTHRDPGMDKESAVMSFLAYARERIDAPISVDIYGSNGWHRMGGVTGQDVEMLGRYVDVICPMYYPSHFGQTFLSSDPAELRPYRIYYFGTLRNYYIARQTVVVRPWVQAFQLNVSYDRHYYGAEYVRNEIRGVHDSLDFGYTYWNSASDYSILRTAFLTNGG